MSTQKKQNELAASPRDTLRSVYMTKQGPLLELLIEVRDRLGSNHALAQALGLSDSRTGRLLRGERESLNTLNCLKFAVLAERDPSEILRAAGKAEIATAIESMYGRSARPTTAAIGPDEAGLLKAWRTLGASQQQTLRVLLRELQAQMENSSSEPARSDTRRRH